MNQGEIRVGIIGCGGFGLYALQQFVQVPGVKLVTYANWFGGAYQDPHNQVFSFAVAPNYLDLYPEMSVSQAERKAFADTRTGVLVGEGLMQRFHWKVGERIPMQRTTLPFVPTHYHHRPR